MLLINSLKRRGVLTTFKVLFSLFFDLIFDIKYGTDTMNFTTLNSLNINSKNRNSGSDYIPSRSRHIEYIFSLDIFNSDLNFTDIGSGKGRVLLMASKYFSKIRGVEFSEELCNISLKNISIYANTVQSNLDSQISIINKDIADYSIDKDENVFYLFNPFDYNILEIFIRNLSESLETNPRICWIIYYYPVHYEVILKSPFFKIFQKEKLDGISCLIFRGKFND